MNDLFHVENVWLSDLRHRQKDNGVLLGPKQAFHLYARFQTTEKIAASTGSVNVSARIVGLIVSMKAFSAAGLLIKMKDRSSP